MKTYGVSPVHTEPTLQIQNRSHYSLMQGDKSSFSISGHVPYRPTDTAVALAPSATWIPRDLLRMCFEQVSEYSACTVEELHTSVKFLFLGFLHSLDSSPVCFLWPFIAVLSSYEQQSGTRS